MVNHETGKVHTAHTTNLVPLILMSDSLKTATLEAGKLCDIAPTLLDLAGIQQPKAMTGHSLVHKAYKVKLNIYNGCQMAVIPLDFMR